METLFRRFRAKPLQTFLTIVQVVLSSFAMTFALSAYLTPSDTRKADRFYMYAGSRDPDGSSSIGTLFLAEHLLDILALTDDVEDIAIYDSVSSSELTYDGQTYKFSTGANVSENYFSMAKLELTAGTVFSSAEKERQEPVVVISQASAKTIFGDADPIGQELRAQVQSSSYATGEIIFSPVVYRVIGVFSDVTGGTTYGEPGIYFPIWARGPSYLPYEEKSQKAQGLVVQAKTGRSEAATQQMFAAVKQVYRDNPEIASATPNRGLFVVTPDELNGQQPGVNPIFIILGLFGIVALVISSIGMFSNTFVDVMRRTHEIGVNRALGATGNHIGRLFSLEAALLSFIGSVLGVALTALLMPLLTKPLEASYLYGTRRLLWQPEAALIVIVVAVLLGAFLAFVSALRAGRMKPIEALRNV